MTPTAVTDVPLVVTQKEAGVGFQVSMASPQATDVSFDWIMVQTYDATPGDVQQLSDIGATVLSGSEGDGLSIPTDTTDATDTADATNTIAAPPPDASTTDSVTNADDSSAGDATGTAGDSSSGNP